MKKIMALLLALMMLFSVATVFAGCEDSGKKKKTSSRRDEEDEDDEENDDEENEDEDRDDEDEEDGDDENEDPTDPEPTETEPSESVFGNQVGDLCYRTILKIADENGETGEMIDPTQTGKVTLINFWGTWCGPCVNEMPHLDMLTKNYDMNVVAIHSYMVQETMPDFIGQYYADSKIIFAYDSPYDGTNGEYYVTMGNVGFYPFSILLDEDGYIVELFVGSITYELISAAVENAGAEKIENPVPPSLNVDVQDAYFGIVDSELAGDYAPRCFHVPEILVNDQVLPNVSQQIMEELLPKEQEYELQNMTYEWWHEGDILSILVRFSWVFNDAVSYQIYNISLSQDKILEDHEFYDAMGVRMHDAILNLTSYLQAYCDSLTPSEYIDQATIDWMIEETLSEENISGSLVFLGADGQINYVTKIAVPAGAGWSVRLYNGSGEAYYITVNNHNTCS